MTLCWPASPSAPREREGIGEAAELTRRGVHELLAEGYAGAQWVLVLDTGPLVAAANLGPSRSTPEELRT